MTTKQTIDGVLVPRELALRLAVPMLRTPEYLLDHRDALDELRALLDAPAALGEIDLTPKRLAHAESVIEQQNELIASLRAELVESYRVAARPQSEPVARVEVGADRNAALTVTDEDWLRSLKDRGAHQIVPLYTEQPAPVAPVLLDQLANGSHLDDVPNHDDDSLSEIAHRCTCGQRSSLLKHAGRVDAEIASINPGAKP